MLVWRLFDAKNENVVKMRLTAQPHEMWLPFGAGLALFFRVVTWQL